MMKDAGVRITLRKIPELITLPAIPHFVSHETFTQNPSLRASGEFLDTFFGIKESVGALSVARYKTAEHVFAESVFLELGGKDKAVISLAHLYEFLRIAPRFCEFFLFFVKDRGGQIWCVDAYWFRGYWNIDTKAMRVTAIDPIHWVVTPVSCE